MSVKLLDACEKHFGKTNLYTVLGVDAKASEKEVKKAYYKLALKVHPDRISGEDDGDRKVSTEKFQILGRVYKILSEKDSRTIYDETGDIGEEQLENAGKEADWDAYWKLIFKKISFADIDAFKIEYQGSEEELKDLKKAYEDSEGDMGHILANVFFAHVDDEERLRKILQNCIQKKELTAYVKFTDESPKKKEMRKRKAEREAEEAEATIQEMGLGNGTDNLVAVIRDRQEQRKEDLISKLEEKFVKKPGKKALKGVGAHAKGEEDTQTQNLKALKTAKKNDVDDAQESSDVEKEDPPKIAMASKAAKKPVEDGSESEKSEEEPPKKMKDSRAAKKPVKNESEDPPKKGKVSRVAKKPVKNASRSEDSEEGPPPKKGKASKVAKKSGKNVSESEESKEDDETPKKVKATRIAKTFGKEVNKSEESEEGKPPTRTRATAPRSAKNKNGKAVITVDSDDSSEEEPPKKARSTKAGKKVTTKTAKSDEEEPPKKTGRAAAVKKPVKKASPKDDSDTIDSDEESEEEKGEPAKKARMTRTVAAKKSGNGVKKGPPRKASAAKTTNVADVESDDVDSDDDLEEEEAMTVEPQKASKDTKKKAVKKANPTDEDEPPKKMRGSSKAAVKADPKNLPPAKPVAGGVKGKVTTKKASGGKVASKRK